MQCKKKKKKKEMHVPIPFISQGQVCTLGTGTSQGLETLGGDQDPVPVFIVPVTESRGYNTTGHQQSHDSATCAWMEEKLGVGEGWHQAARVRHMLPAPERQWQLGET